MGDATTLLDLPAVETVLDGDRRDPYPGLAAMAAESPYWRLPSGAVVAMRHADANQVLRDPRWSSNPKWLRGAAAEGAETDPVRFVGSTVLLFMDPPDHTRVRGLVAKAFTPRRVEQMRDHIADLVDDLLDAVCETGRIDILDDLAYPLPVTVICEMLGVPLDDHPRFRTLSSDSARLLDGLDALSPDELAAALTATGEIITYFDALSTERRAAPGDDLLSALLAAEVEGERLDHLELLSIVALLFGAGHETTMNLIGNGMLALARNRDQLVRLQADPGLVRSAVEELLRYDPPVQADLRIATEDLRLGPLTIPAGSEVVIPIGAVNRDPAVFADPHTLDLGRSPNPHLSFAAGAHYCLGASLARLEGEIVFTKLLERFDDLELVTTEPELRPHRVLRGLQSLEMAFSPGAPRRH